MEDPFARRANQPLDILLLYNDTTGVRRGNETDDLPESDESSIAPVMDALASLGHHVRMRGVSYDELSLLDGVEERFFGERRGEARPFVFNLCEGTGLDGHPGLEVISALEAQGVPFSGTGSLCYWLTT